MTTLVAMYGSSVLWALVFISIKYTNCPCQALASLSLFMAVANLMCGLFFSYIIWKRNMAKKRIQDLLILKGPQK